jgi:hypothetical protein
MRACGRWTMSRARATDSETRMGAANWHRRGYWRASGGALRVIEPACGPSPRAATGIGPIRPARAKRPTARLGRSRRRAASTPRALRLPPASRQPLAPTLRSPAEVCDGPARHGRQLLPPAEPEAAGTGRHRVRHTLPSPRASAAIRPPGARAPRQEHPVAVDGRARRRLQAGAACAAPPLCANAAARRARCRAAAAARWP